MEGSVTADWEQGADNRGTSQATRMGVARSAGHNAWYKAHGVIAANAQKRALDKQGAQRWRDSTGARRTFWLRGK